jgi:hypothetical protein
MVHLEIRCIVNSIYDTVFMHLTYIYFFCHNKLGFLKTSFIIFWLHWMTLLFDDDDDDDHGP